MKIKLTEIGEVEWTNEDIKNELPPKDELNEKITP